MTFKMISSKSFLTYLSGCLSCFMPSLSFAQSPSKILLIHSYHPEYPWVASITEGVQNALQGKDIDLEIFYRDTKRKTSALLKTIVPNVR